MHSTRLRYIPVLAALAVAACSDAPTLPDSAADVKAPSLSVAEDGSDTYLVRFNGNGVPSDFASTVAALGGEVIFAHEAGIAAVGGLSNAAADELAANSSIAAVDADAYTTLEDPLSTDVESSDATPQSPTNPAGAVFFARQWHMRAIQANVAWTAGKRGSSSVKVGIVDTGIDPTHVDLIGRVDTQLSRSFLSAAENARVTNTFGPATPLWVDLHYHGTHVGATVASNARAAAGVTSGTTLVALKVCTPAGRCPTSGTLAAILYAADNGIPIINMSLGGGFQRSEASARGGDGPSFIATINQTVNYAHGKGTSIVVSAGNSAIDLDHDGNGYASYCSAPNVICVSATGPTAAAGVNGPWTNVDALATYSNYGRSAISVAAPGGMGGTRSVWAACSRYSIVIPICRTGNFILGISGTSMASPHVAGVGALIAADGTTKPAQVRAKLQQSADDLGEPGTDPAYGKGRINAARAVGAI